MEGCGDVVMEDEETCMHGRIASCGGEPGEISEASREDVAAVKGRCGNGDVPMVLGGGSSDEFSEIGSPRSGTWEGAMSRVQGGGESSDGDDRGRGVLASRPLGGGSSDEFSEARSPSREGSAGDVFGGRSDDDVMEPSDAERADDVRGWRWRRQRVESVIDEAVRKRFHT